MSKYVGDLTDFGQTNSLFGKNLEADYRKPKEELELAEDLPDFNDMSIDELKALVPENWHDDSDTDYWEDRLYHFDGKDGQTNAYVKRGLDDEETEILERQQTNIFTWHFSTDDNHIRFLAGGKIYAKGREWFLLKVISQDSTSSTTNKYEAMDTSPYNKQLLQFGFKILVLV